MVKMRERVLDKPNIIKDVFMGQQSVTVALNQIKKAGRGILVYLRYGAAGVPVAPLDETKTAGSRSQPSMARRSVSVRKFCATSA